MTRLRYLLKCLAWLGVLLPCFAVASPITGYGNVPVFKMPAVADAQITAFRQAATRDFSGAARIIEQLVTAYPDASTFRVGRAVVAAMAGDTETAIAALRMADDLGAPDLGKLLTRPGMAALAKDPRLQDIADREAALPKPPKAALVRHGQALVETANTAWDPQVRRLVSRFTFPPILKTHTFEDRPARQGPLAELHRLISRGRAAGNVGDLYDNRDDGHSKLWPGRRIQLTHTVYGEDAQAEGIHYGLNTQILFNAPTFGNSSTALVGQNWRSQPRFAMTTPGGAARLWQLYAANHVYVFPEHTDHDPVAEKGHGDLFPAMTPYILISQGSSGSDRPLLQAIQVILAAFPRDVKARLVDERLIAPMVQQIFRRGLKGVDPDGYMGPLAHQTVIRGEDIDLGRLIRLAQGLKISEIPPMVTLQMRSETPPNGSIFADGLTEALFDTPGALARVWRGAGQLRTYELEAAAQDPNGREISFHWRVLRGDAARISIEPLDATGRRVRITLPWHDPAPVPGRPDITSPRVDIAVFADNGAQISAPAYFSMLYPAHQQRRHDAVGRLLSIDHRHPPEVYADPNIWPRRDWEDTFLHDAERRVIGWTRRGADGQAQSFTAHGLEVLDYGSDGRPARARRVAYPITRNEKGQLAVTEISAPETFYYRYSAPDDRIGRPVPE
ncbi:MAG: hypothetical protein AAF439_03265 [Pseudomonadota bacterium]